MYLCVSVCMSRGVFCMLVYIYIIHVSIYICIYISMRGSVVMCISILCVRECICVCVHVYVNIGVLCVF